jgi:D-aminopeptidase
MSRPQAAELERAAGRLAQAFPGPGGACAVVKDGEVLIRHAWGWANAERRITFTPASLFRICSITKQFTCATVLDALGDPAALDPILAERLSHLEGQVPSARQMADNQSGLRDYWAVAMLHGSPAEAPFGPSEAAEVISRTGALQFAPGTRYSYVNQNFRLLGEALEAHTGRSFAELLRRGVFAKAGMESAILAADTRALPDGTEGYEGAQASGFRLAENRILWTGDAGIAASLDDMIAYERWIDATRDDEAGLYRRLSAPATFADGAAATYGLGLGRGEDLGRQTTGHGGALRGWRSHRLHSAADRLSVVVFFNHLSDARAAALDLFTAALGRDARKRRPKAPPRPPWLGAYLDPETGLAARIDAGAEGQVILRFGHWPETLEVADDDSAGAAHGTSLRRTGAGLEMTRPSENQVSRLKPLRGEPTLDGAGRYLCAELGARLTIVDAGGALYGAFSGFLGEGRMELMEPIAQDVWALPCWRALDHTPPGDWTVHARRDGAGQIEGITVGCWLARGFDYRPADKWAGMA